MEIFSFTSVGGGLLRHKKRASDNERFCTFGDVVRTHLGSTITRWPPNRSDHHLMIIADDVALTKQKRVSGKKKLRKNQRSSFKLRFCSKETTIKFLISHGYWSSQRIW